MRFLRKVFFVYISSKFININRNLSFENLNFKRLDFTNYKQIKSFIFKKNFFKQDNLYVDSFDFLNFSQNLGGKIGINLSKKTIIEWYSHNKNKINYPWSEDLISRRIINILYNYEFINSSSTENEKKILRKIIYIHMYRLIFEFKFKKIYEISSYDLIAVMLSLYVLEKKNITLIKYVSTVIEKQLDYIGVHKSYNILEHAKFLNNICELKNIFLYINISVPETIEKNIYKMTSILNEYFHTNGSLPLFNGANNNYTKIINESLNKEEYLKIRNFSNAKNGLAFFSGKNKKIFFDVVQPNKQKNSNNLSAGTLAFEFSCLGEKIITNCGASESLGKNPEYLRYSAAHSTIILQNTNISEIRENNPHIKFPQSVTFESSRVENRLIFEGSHNGYQKKFNKIIKRRLEIIDNEDRILGEDSIISIKKHSDKIIYHIRFHLIPGFSYNFTNNKKNIILKSKLNNMWIFKSDIELFIEDSILVDENTTMPTKQIVLKGLTTKNKVIRKWSLEKI